MRHGILDRRHFLGATAATLMPPCPRALAATYAPTATPVTIVSENDVSSLDPHLIRNNHPIGSVIWSLFDSLVRRRPDGTHAPRLALSWSQISATQWIFRLRPGVRFHNGERFDAQAVAVNFERMNRSPFNGESQLWQQTGLERIDALEPDRVRLVTAAPCVDLLYWLEEAFIGAPAHLRDTPADQVGAEPVGSGPYRFVEWVRGDHVSLTANSEYWEGAVPIRDVVFRAVPELSARLGELAAGTADLVPELDPDAAALATRSARGRVVHLRGLEKVHLGISQNGIAPLRDRRVRQALNRAVDVQLLVETLERGMTARLRSLLNPPNATADLPPYDHAPEHAADLLRAAGHDRFSVELAYDASRADGEEICEAIADDLSKLGLQPRLASYESGRFAEMLRRRDFPGLFLHGLAALINPLVELGIFTSGAVDNGAGYVEPRIDALLGSAARTPDAAKRRATLLEAEQLIWDDAPWVFLWAQPAIYGMSDRLRYLPRPDQYVEIYRAGVEG